MKACFLVSASKFIAVCAIISFYSKIHIYSKFWLFKSLTPSSRGFLHGLQTECHLRQMRMRTLFCINNVSHKDNMKIDDCNINWLSSAFVLSGADRPDVTSPSHSTRYLRELQAVWSLKFFICPTKYFCCGYLGQTQDQLIA